MNKYRNKKVIVDDYIFDSIQERIGIKGYFADNGKIKKGAITEICSDIDRGLWDGCFYWDIENYNNVTATNSLLNTAINQILSQQNTFS